MGVKVKKNLELVSEIRDRVYAPSVTKIATLWREKVARRVWDKKQSAY